MSQFTLSLDLFEYGTIQASVKTDEQSLTIFATYLDDAPGRLAEALLSLLRAPLGDSAVCSWQDEPGEHRWLFHCNQDKVEVEILRFAETFSRLPDERGERIFRAECSLLRLATQVKGQLHQLFNTYGEQGYESHWRRPFPMSVFRQLEAQIRKRKHVSEVERR